MNEHRGLQQLLQRLRERIDHLSSQIRASGEVAEAFASRASDCSKAFEALLHHTHDWDKVTVERPLPSGGESDEFRIKDEVLEYRCTRCQATAPPDAGVQPTRD